MREFQHLILSRSWLVEGAYFAIASSSSFAALSSGDLSRKASKVECLGWVLYEICCGNSFLICLVVLFVLIPAFEASGNVEGLRIMRSKFAWSAHNLNGESIHSLHPLSQDLILNA